MVYLTGARQSGKTTFVREIAERLNMRFRDKRKHEVDIVIERSNANIIGIGVKASASVKTQNYATQFAGSL